MQTLAPVNNVKIRNVHAIAQRSPLVCTPEHLSKERATNCGIHQIEDPKLFSFVLPSRPRPKESNLKFMSQFMCHRGREESRKREKDD